MLANRGLCVRAATVGHVSVLVLVCVQCVNPYDRTRFPLHMCDFGVYTASRRRRRSRRQQQTHVHDDDIEALALNRNEYIYSHTERVCLCACVCAARDPSSARTTRASAISLNTPLMDAAA